MYWININLQKYDYTLLKFSLWHPHFIHVRIIIIIFNHCNNIILKLNWIELNFIAYFLIGPDRTGHQTNQQLNQDWFMVSVFQPNNITIVLGLFPCTIMNWQSLYNVQEFNTLLQCTWFDNSHRMYRNWLFMYIVQKLIIHVLCTGIYYPFKMTWIYNSYTIYMNWLSMYIVHGLTILSMYNVQELNIDVKCTDIEYPCTMYINVLPFYNVHELTIPIQCTGIE